MYAQRPDLKDRTGAIVAVIAIHGLIALALLNLSGTVRLTDDQPALEVFDLSEVEPPPPEPPPPPPAEQRQRPRPKGEEGAASPPNIRSQATPIVAPKPRIELPIPLPINASETPNQGTAATQGAADVRGIGTGAGGTGTGTGSGGAGGGSGGGGGDGGIAEPPRLLTPVLRGRDFPPHILDSWPRGAQVFLRFRISPAGTISECFVDRGTGVPAIDSQICQVAQRNFRYRPAVSRSGRAVAGWAGYRQTPPR